MNPSMETSPTMAVLLMVDILDSMEYHSDVKSKRRVIQDTETYFIKYASTREDYDRRTWELCGQVMRAFLEFVRYHHDGAISSCKKRLSFTDDEQTPIKQ